ncbi:MAG: hypothetical protein KDB27_29250, partial [Planctomycetales bacterium]|nr:hypothetical protein [Planctomycetales bacterium]
MYRTIVMAAALSVCGLSTSQAGIIKLSELGLDGDAPAEIGNIFGEDVLTFSDRTHQHNGAAFDDAGTLSVSGSNVVPLPSYLVGNQYVKFANNARDNANYAATFMTDDVSAVDWYLLVDN